MAASSLLLLRLSEFLRARKIALAEDAAHSCQDDRRLSAPGEAFPWRERVAVMLQATADSLLLRASAEGGASSKNQREPVDSASAGIQTLLTEAWLVRNAFLRALNRFQGEQASKRTDYTALDMTEVRQEAVQEFDRAVSGALAEWIAGTARASAVPAAAVSDLYDGMRAIQGLLQLAADSIPTGAKAHVSAAVLQLGRLAASAQTLISGDADAGIPQTGITPALPASGGCKPGLAIAPLDVPTFVQSIAETARPAAQKKGVMLEYRRNPGPQVLQTDGEKLHRAVTLLLNYSLSFTDQGEVSLTTGADEKGKWTLEIRDTSAGAPPAILAKLLKGVAYTPDDQASAGEPGIGVALARDLILLLDGTLAAHSEPGEGNCFTVTLRPS